MISQLLLAAWMGAIIGSGGGDTAAVPAGCDNLGTYEFYWDGEHSSGTTTGCTTGGTTTLVESGGVTNSSAQNHTAAGTYSMAVGASNADVQLTRSAVGLTGAEGYVSLWFYATADETCTFFEMQYDGNNFVLAYYRQDTGKIYVYREATNVSENAQLITAIPTSTWTQLEFRWKASSSTLSIRMNGGGWTETGGTPDEAFEGEATLIRFGESDSARYMATGTLYIDDVYIDTTAP